MITNLILIIIYGFIFAITSPLRLLSDASLPTEMTTSLTTAGQIFGSTSEFLPIATIISVFSILFVVEIFIFTYKIIRWIYQKIPTIN